MRGRRRREINSAGGADHRGDHDPGVVAPERAVEEPAQPGRDGGGAQAQRGAHLARLDQEVRWRAAPLLVHPGGGEAVEPVVDEHLAEDRVVTAPVDIGPVVGRHGGDRGHEAQRDEHHHDEWRGRRDRGAGEGRRRAPPSGRRRRGRARPARPGASWPERPGPPTPRPGPTTRAFPVMKAFVVASAASTRSRIRRESEMLPRLRRIVTGLTASTSAAARPAPGPGHPADGPVQDEHGQRALEDLGQHDGPQVKAEEAQREGLDPQRARQLVHRDGAPRVEGAEDEVVPTRRHAAGGGAVEGLEGHVPDAPGVSRGGQRGHGQESGPGPARLVGWRAPEAKPRPADAGAVIGCSRTGQTTPGLHPGPGIPGGRGRGARTSSTRQGPAARFRARWRRHALRYLRDRGWNDESEDTSWPTPRRSRAT